MIPIYLKIKGIYSYQKEQIIDFTQLTSTGIFGIFGNVGSGKSSILEAMTFALYDEIERLNKRDGRAYNLMNLKSDDFLIDLIIKNNEGNEYRFVVKGKRNSKKFDDVNIKRFVYKKENNEWQPFLRYNTEEIIGLNYDNFRRTIIIPQGKFQDFLQLTDGERTKMMKELFKLHRYDLSGKVSNIEKENNHRLSGVSGQLLQLNEVSEEKIKTLSLEINEINDELISVKSKQKILQKQNEEWEKISELFKQIDKLKPAFKYLSEKEQYYQQLEDELGEYNYCMHKFKLPLQNKTQTQERIKTLSTDLNKQKENLSQLKKQITFYESKILELEPQYAVREKLKKQAEDLKKLLEIKKIETDISTLNKRIADGDKIINQNNENIRLLENQQTELKRNISDIKEKMPDLNILSTIKDWFTVSNNLQKQINEHNADLQNLSKKIEQSEQNIKNMLQDFDANIHLINKETLNKLLDDKFEQVEKEIEYSNHFFRELKIKQALIDYSKNLHEGEPCPVCGSTNHPNKIVEHDLNKEISLLEEKIANFKKTQKQIQKTIGSVNKLFNQLENFIENRHKVETKLIKLETELAKHKKNYPVKEKLSEKELNEAFSKANVLQIELKNAEIKLQDAENKYKKAFENKEKYEKGLNILKNDLIKMQSQKETLLAQITVIKYNNWQAKTQIIITQQIKTLNDNYIEISKQYEKSVEELNKLKTETAKFEGSIQTIEKDLLANKIILDKLDKEINLLLKNSDYKNIDEVLHVLNKNLDIEKLSKEISNFKQEFFSISEQLKKLEEQTKNKEYNTTKHRELIDNLKNSIQKAELLGKKAGALERDKQQLETKLIEKQNLQKELEKLQLRAENIRILKSLFAGNGFVNYVSSVYLRNLVNAANERFFRLTGQKLKLELNENNNFEIRDFMNDGKVRSVKTLSGGQTFQASLSLALTLADNLQSMSGSKSNFFFLDEGFGMLDKDALNIVFDTLKTLRKENRIVGIISHVEDLQLEIETYLKIENNPQTGSIILKSWEN